MIIHTSCTLFWITLKRIKCLISVFQFAFACLYFMSAISVKAKHATGFSTPDNSPKFPKRNTKRTVRCHSPVVTCTKRFCGNAFLFSSSSSSELELRGEPHVHARTCIYYIRLTRRIHQWALVMLGCRNPAPPLLFDAQRHAHHRRIPCRGVAHVLLWSQPLFG